MLEKHLQIQTNDGEMETYLVHPGGTEPAPIVVIYMDAPGIRAELHDFARRIAREGYCCVLPDLYYRRGRVRFDLRQMTADQGKEMFTHMESLSNALVIADTESLLAALQNEPLAASGPKGCIGYCMSGQFIMSVAGSFPDDFHASVSCYGVGIVTPKPDSPHRLAQNVQGEIFFAFAEIDQYVPDDVIPTLREELAKYGIVDAIETYPGTHHGFCFPERVGAYNEPAAEDVWRKTFAMFDRQLK
jgi:carboxymethylenebutenolidase